VLNQRLRISKDQSQLPNNLICSDLNPLLCQKIEGMILTCRSLWGT
jgi:hypothetical protein